MSARTATLKRGRRTKAEQLTLDGGALAAFPDLGAEVEPELRVRPAPIWWSWMHAARLGAAGWAIGSLLGLTYVVLPFGLTLDLPFDLVAAGWTLGAVAGTAVGALLGGILGGLLLRFRRWRRWRAER